MIISQNIHSQKLYIWCQKEQIPTPRIDFLAELEIDLVIFDDLTTSQNFITEPSNKKGSQGPRNRWGQMK